MVGNANANGVPFIKNGTSFLKDNIVLWYDIKRQGATNESMSQNPILKDLSGHGHDATCYNFAWTENSGISSTSYPNALVSDGVDDYAYVEGLPLLTDCTAFIMRDLIDFKRDSITVVKGRIGSSVNGYSIMVDRIDLEVSMAGYSFLTSSVYSDSWLKDKLIIGSPTFINEWENNLDRINDAFDLLHLLGEPYSQYYAQAALYSFILFNRTLTTKEINWVKENLIEGDTKL